MTVVDRTEEQPTAADLELHEASISLVENTNGSVVADDGTITIHVIRPTVGRGRGNHLYEAAMLKEHAHIFGEHTRPDGTEAKGWKMYVNHLSAKGRAALGGLPRSVQDLGGRIVESWWDDSVPANGRFEQGAVVAKAKPTPFMRELIENDPDIVEASISAQATGVRPGSVGGKKVWVVEGIQDTGSVDWVTEAGAGGKVASLLEAALTEHSAEEWSELSDMDESEFTEYLRAERPHLIEAVAKSEATQEEVPMEITPEMLTEALQSDSGREAVKELVTEMAAPLIEAAVAEERELIRAEARADADRQIALRDMRDAAHTLIDEASVRWPAPWISESKARFDLVDGEPTVGLNVVEIVGEEGKVEKTASQVLTEAVSAEIERQNGLLAAARPTRVRGQGERVEEAANGGEKKPSEGTLYGSILEEAGVDPETAWA